ncbi:MAG: cupin domain-containing protein [Gammaproteobacteria bacterium]|nr:cupin domain-containing protein [Gammaproteobacteria bacterium]
MVRLILALLLLVAVAAAAQQQRGGFFSNFVGDIEIVDSEEMRSSRIRFDAGARTNWHVHSAPQLILIEQGQGRLQEQGGPVRVLRAGEPVLTEANVPHWHGADPEQEAVQFSVYSGTLEWLEPVTDDEYFGR